MKYADQLFKALQAADAAAFTNSFELSTLEEHDPDLMTAMIDRSVTLPDFGEVSLMFDVIVDIGEDGQFQVGGVDPNAENVYVHLPENIHDWEFEGEQYDRFELASLTSFKDALLATPLRNLGFEEATRLIQSVAGSPRPGM